MWFLPGTRKDPEFFYPALDVVALTSRNEGTPLTLIEAMLNARPVIATSVGGVVDLLGNRRPGMLGLQSVNVVYVLSPTRRQVLRRDWPSSWKTKNCAREWANGAAICRTELRQRTIVQGHYRPLSTAGSQATGSGRRLCPTNFSLSLSSTDFSL